MLLMGLLLAPHPDITHLWTALGVWRNPRGAPHVETVPQHDQSAFIRPDVAEPMEVAVVCAQIWLPGRPRDASTQDRIPDILPRTQSTLVAKSYSSMQTVPVYEGAAGST